MSRALPAFQTPLTARPLLAAAAAQSETNSAPISSWSSTQPSWLESSNIFLNSVIHGHFCFELCKWFVKFVDVCNNSLWSNIVVYCYLKAISVSQLANDALVSGLVGSHQSDSVGPLCSRWIVGRWWNGKLLSWRWSSEGGTTTQLTLCRRVKSSNEQSWKEGISEVWSSGRLLNMWLDGWFFRCGTKSE